VIAAWWLQAAVISTALALTAWALEAGFAALGRPRRWAWVAAMVATVALVAIGPLRQMGDAQPATGDAVALTQVESSAFAALTAWFAGLALPDVNTPLLLLWAGVAGIALVVTLFSLHRVSARVRRTTRVVVQGTQVRVSPADGPMVVGLLRPEIVVPSSLLQRDSAEVRLVLAHEQSHIAARDPWLLAGAAVVVALLSGLPALWWMRARLRLAIEIDCDQRVLAGRRDRVAAYGDLLLALASRRAFPGPIPLGLSLHPSTLERRDRKSVV
jgi:bla regulator protein BlaR1